MVLIIVSTIPTGIIGFVGKDVVEQASELLIVPGICLIVTAILLFIADRCKGGDKLPKDITYTNAFVVGIAQGVATLLDYPAAEQRSQHVCSADLTASLQ